MNVNSCEEPAICNSVKKRKLYSRNIKTTPYGVSATTLYYNNKKNASVPRFYVSVQGIAFPFRATISLYGRCEIRCELKNPSDFFT